MHDPLAVASEAEREYGIELLPREALAPADALILAVPHATYIDGGWALVTGLLRDGGAVIDVKTRLDRNAKPDNIDLWRP